VTATRRITTVWLALLALTFASFLVGVEQSADTESIAAIVIIGVALFKVRLIGLHFMDLRVAPQPLRLLFEGYVLVVFVALTIIDLVVS
jgi:caa(3)-type oxidase subunit IV